MTRDFVRVRFAASQSIAGRALRRIVVIVGAAWATAVTGQSVRTISRRFAALPPAQRLRWAATVVAIAAALHLIFRAVMPAAVVPALPAALVLAFAAIAAMTAWRAESVHRAWRQSRLARLFGRST